jgi:hypothetical protein
MRRYGQVFAVAVLLVQLSTIAFAMDDPLCKMVGNKWQWFGDHAALTIEYQITGAPGRRWEAGTGPSLFGEPLGSESTHEGYFMITAYGVGALHIRADDDDDPFMVCVTGDITRLIPICPQFDIVCPE